MNIIQALDELENRIRKGKKFYSIDCGLCENLSNIANKYFTNEIKEMVKDWKHFSGDLTYPVSGIDVYNHNKLNESLWVGEQLKLRKSLISHIRKKYAVKQK